jgi:Prokaryotic E2 family A/ThiF family/Prokaryotic homologs of the JAB domain
VKAMAIHPWWAQFGEVIQDDADLCPMAKSIWAALRSGVPGSALVEVRRDKATARVGIQIDIDVERPQDLALPIRAREAIAVLLTEAGDSQPAILSLRHDFPDSDHQTWVPEGFPLALCTDDRPWSEASLSWTPVDMIRRIQLWLAKAARGELHETARPLEPLFFPAPQSLVIPRAALANADNPIELVGFVHAEDKRVIVTRDLATLPERLRDGGRLLVAVVHAGDRPMTRMRHAPSTLGRLADELALCDVDLPKLLRAQMQAWAGLDKAGVRRLTSMLAIVVVFHLQGKDGQVARDIRAFITADTAGAVGVGLGALLANKSDKGAKEGFVRALVPGPLAIDNVRIEPSEVHLSFDRRLGAQITNRQVDDRKVALIGAGSLGSQVALNLAREGGFRWSIVDDDRLLPHNIARHALMPEDVGLPKAIAVARTIERLTGEPTASLCEAITRASAQGSEGVVRQILSEAEIIIDASASVAAARCLSDCDVPARRVSIFFNPAGTDIVVLTEAADRSVTLRDLEAQYYSMLLSTPQLAAHLSADVSRIRYSGSCRSLTNKISASNAALLSAFASRGIVRGLHDTDGSIRIWSTATTGETAFFERIGTAPHRIELGGWKITYDRAVLECLSDVRRTTLPTETGGVLIGIADMACKSLHLVSALPAPPDSVHARDQFERGVEGLEDAIAAVADRTMHQVRYIGEWHSHPPKTPPLPSAIDMLQLKWLASSLAIDGLPALMAIAAEDGQFGFMLSDQNS